MSLSDMIAIEREAKRMMRARAKENNFEEVRELIIAPILEEILEAIISAEERGGEAVKGLREARRIVGRVSKRLA